ncbi:chemotaxis protein CheW [Planctomycetaceae bacterium SH139]
MDAELLKEFLQESFEGLEQLDNDIVALEKDPSRGDLMSAIFRAIHTIKGSCGFMSLHQLESVAHATETVLGKMRDGQLAVTSDVISDVLSGVDLIKELLNGVEAEGTEPTVDIAAAISRLNEIAEGSYKPSPAGRVISSDDVETELEAGTDEMLDQEAMGAAAGLATTAGSSAANNAQNMNGSADGAPISKPAATKGGESVSSIADMTVRISTDVLDDLMNLVGELVLTRNELLQLSRHDQDSQYYNPISQLNRVTTELQEGIMKTRMQPISTVWNKLPRMVRELSKATGKPLELTLTGESTELDRTVLEAIRDPLTHMLRNSADHGIESPDERVANGKTRHGNIALRAFHESGQVIIEISDDGGGVDRNKVLQRAIERGLVPQATAHQLSDHDVLQYIFEPGFSTADKISNLSGRGVGMDVVRTAIESIGGGVEVFSQIGRGTTLKVRIPLTLAIISALLVKSENSMFAIPQVGIVELVALNGHNDERLAWLQDRALFRRRDRLLPLLRLSDVLGLSAQPFGAADQIAEESTIVVVQVDNHDIGLVVDRVLDTEEIVVKPVGASVQSEGLYQGATILGDGQVIMILDSESLVRQEGIDFAAVSEAEAKIKSGAAAGPATSRILLIEDGGENPIGISLAQVSRLEEFPVSAINHNGNTRAVSYRNDILPLVPLSSNSEHASGVQPVVVFSDEHRTIGLMIQSIHDIKDAEIELRFESSQPGILGSALMNDEIIELLDPRHFLASAVKRIERDPVLMLVSENPIETEFLTEPASRFGYPVRSFTDVSEALAFLEGGRKTAGVLCSTGQDTRAWRAWWSELTYRRGNGQLAAAVTGMPEALPGDIASMLAMAGIPVTGGEMDWLFSALQEQWAEHSPRGVSGMPAKAHEDYAPTVCRNDQYVSFTVSGHHFGLPVTAVQEVLIAGGISSVPYLADDVQGLLNLRGQIVTAIDLRQRLQLNTVAETASCNVVVQGPWGAFGLLVDAVGDVVDIPSTAREAVPCTIRPSFRRFASSVARVEESLVTLLDTDRLLNLSAA